jgi:hypothetical protein
MDAEDWLADMKKHFVSSNVRPKDFVRFATFHLKDQAADWWQPYKDSREGQVIAWDVFCKDFRAGYIHTSAVEGMCEKFRNLKQGTLVVYQYNSKFQRLARYAKQDVLNDESKIYQFRNGLRDDLQFPLTLYTPTESQCSTTWLLSKKQLTTRWKLQGTGPGTPPHLLRPLRLFTSTKFFGFQVLLHYILNSTSSLKIVVLPTLPTQLIKRGLGLRGQEILLTLIRSQM